MSICGPQSAFSAIETRSETNCRYHRPSFVNAHEGHKSGSVADFHVFDKIIGLSYVKM